MSERPEYVTDDHLEYLDDLRESGVTNMFCAAHYLAKKFELSSTEASRILFYWMLTFGKENR